MCLDLSDSQAKVLIGYNVGGKPIVAFSDAHPIDGVIKEGMVIDQERLIGIVSSLREVSDPATHFSASINSGVCLLLPPMGLKIYQNEQTTNVVSEASEITKTDITNVTSMFQKFALPDSHLKIVDIIPDEFILENGERYANPPLGKVSRRLTMKAKIYALPESIVSSYSRVLSGANLRSIRTAVAPYCQSELFKTYPDLPPTYLLIDMGSKITSVSLIGKGSCYCCHCINLGGDDLTAEIADAFGIDMAFAEKIKRDYGYDTRAKSLNPPLISSGERFYQENLNAIIEAHFERMDSSLGNCISKIVGPYNGTLDNIPLLFTGGASSLFGIRELLAHAFPNRELYFPEIRTIGARERGFAAALGMILTAYRYTGSLEDNLRGVASLTRPKTAKTEKMPRGYHADIDNL